MHEGLVEQAKRGDAEAFDSLARLVGDRCLAIAVRILRDLDTAQDAVQAALVTAWIELRTLRDPTRFEPWLHRILTNACYAEARRRTRWSEALRIVPAAGAYDPGDFLTIDDRDQLAARGGGSNRPSRRDREVPSAPRHAGAPGQPRG